MWQTLKDWLLVTPEEKSRTRELVELSLFYLIFVGVVWVHGELPIRLFTLFALFPVGLLVAAYWEDARELLRIALIAGIIVFGLVRPFVVQAFYIPSRSMENTLMVNDHIFVNKFVYHFEKPERWDVIVFEYPKDPKKDYIKRLVGLPGDTIAIRDHELYVNGKHIARRYVDTEVELQFFPPAKAESWSRGGRLSQHTLRFEGDGMKINREFLIGTSSDNPVDAQVGITRIYREGRTHLVKETSYEGLRQAPSYTKNFGPIYIPKKGEKVDLRSLDSTETTFYINLMRQWFDEAITYRNGMIYRGGVAQTRLKIHENLYFAMGDNRDHSEDSRAWGFVPESRLLGEAFFIYWPLDRIGFIGSG